MRIVCNTKMSNTAIEISKNMETLRATKQDLTDTIKKRMNDIKTEN